MNAAFNGILGALRAVYEQEIARLADEYRARILAGEFSDWTPRGDKPVPEDEPRYLRLEDELRKTHPWIIGGERQRLAVVACSRWLEAVEKARTNPRTGEKLGINWDGDFADALAAECMSHDILAAAARRGWVKPMRYLGDSKPYALRVA